MRSLWISTFIATLCVVWLAGWLPHYLTWPWWIDTDTYAWIARGIPAGRLPYRDVSIFNFPGQIGIHWLLGSLFGWGHTWTFYAFDAALLIAFLTALVVWSHRVAGSIFAGWIGALMVLAYYLDCDYRTVAQRDWQGPLLALSALLLLQSFRTKSGAVASAALLALAFAIRPHIVLFLPAFVALLIVNQEPGPEANRPSIHAVLWTFLTALLAWTFLAFLPLLVSGTLPDLLRELTQVGYATRYGKLGRSGVLEVFSWQLGLVSPNPALREPIGWLRQVDRLKLVAVLVASGVVAWRSPSVRRTHLPWLIAALGALVYAPLHPKPHAYLAHPLRLVVAVNFVFVAAWMLNSSGRMSVRRWIALAALFGVAILPGWPRFWNPERSLAALGILARGQVPVSVPLGAADHFSPGDGRSPYSWTDYRNALIHLRQHTDETTVVANQLRNVPFPAINGPTGRVSPLDAEGGLAYLYLVNPARETRFARAVADAPAGSVVVWDPERPSFTPDLALPDLSAAVRTHYRPEARFGAIEIWRKR